jgi:hyperosmotically inducible protein
LDTPVSYSHTRCRLVLPSRCALHSDHTVYAVCHDIQGEDMNSITRYAAVAAIAASLAASGCNVFRGQSTPGEYVDDVAITTKVKAELLDSGKVEGLDVNVDSMNGKVTLTGWADTAAERTTAGTIASSVDGVKSVDNQLKIKE